MPMHGEKNNNTLVHVEHKTVLQQTFKSFSHVRLMVELIVA